MAFDMGQILLFVHSLQVLEKLIPAPQRLLAHSARDKVEQVVPCFFRPCLENTATQVAFEIVLEACGDATCAVLTLRSHDEY